MAPSGSVKWWGRRMAALQAIGRIFLIEVAHRDGTYFPETGILPRGKDMTEREGLEELWQHDDAVAVWEWNPGEGTSRDVSEDMAREWLNNHFDGDEEVLPGFIETHLSDDEIAEHFADREAWEDHYREISSPEMTGRI